MMNIVVIDDEIDTHLLYKMKFRKMSAGKEELHVESFLGAEECLMYLEGNLNGVDMILTDINMPGMDGFELLKHVKDLDKKIPVYMISAYESTDYRRKALELGAAGFLNKPVDFNQLADVINRSSKPNSF
jgi:DNA-binding NtrC family response regulator